MSAAVGRLGPGTVALYTIVEPDKYRVIVVTSQTEKAEEYPIAEKYLARKIAALRDALQDPTIDPRPLARNLYDILIGPIRKDLDAAGARTLMWSLDGVLRYLPMAALYDGKQYMVERYSQEVFTLANRIRLEEAPQAQWTALGLGVSKAQPGFEALPSVPTELHDVVDDGPPPPSQPTKGVLPGRVMLDDQFTRDAMVSALAGTHFPVVHIASHFAFRPGNDTDSFLLLGDGSHLTLAAIKALPTVFRGVDLLTLSACDTAMTSADADGREIDGCAVIAERQGARAVMASLFPVSDAGTQTLMLNFYRGRRDHLASSKADALRQAQMALLNGGGSATVMPPAPKLVSDSLDDQPPFPADQSCPFAHPFYWAPFILIGNWK